MWRVTLDNFNADTWVSPTNRSGLKHLAAWKVWRASVNCVAIAMAFQKLDDFVRNTGETSLAARSACLSRLLFVSERETLEILFIKKMIENLRSRKSLSAIIAERKHNLVEMLVCSTWLLSGRRAFGMTPIPRVCSSTVNAGILLRIKPSNLWNSLGQNSSRHSSPDMVCGQIYR